MAQLYQSNIPALDDVTNPIAANDLRYAKAPGIVHGQNIDPGNLQFAVDEANALKIYRHIRPNHVTASEAGQALDRVHAIANEHSAGNYAQAMAPAWFNNALNVALAPILNAIQSNQDAIQSNQDAIQSNQDAIQSNQDAIQSNHANIITRLENQNIKRRNNGVIALGDLPLVPLKKQVAGIGNGLPGRNVLIAPVDFAALGDSVPLPPFPATKTELNRLTSDDLAKLSALYNEDFGIILGDTTEVQRSKFENFIA